METATFKEVVVYGVGILPTGIDVGDFNRDGNPAIANANYNSNTALYYQVREMEPLNLLFLIMWAPTLIL